MSENPPSGGPNVSQQTSWGGASPPAKFNTGKIQSLDLARTVAILIVLAGHSRPALDFPKTPIFQYIWNSLSVNMGIGVIIFFVLSGFLITRLLDGGPGGLERPDLRWFYARRAGRIFPLGICTLLLGACMIHFVRDSRTAFAFIYGPDDVRYDAWFWLSFPTFSFNLLQIARSQTDIYTHHWSLLWSLSIEEQFYLLYPLALRWMRNDRIRFLSLGAVVLSGPLFRCVAQWMAPNFTVLYYRFRFPASNRSLWVPSCIWPINAGTVGSRSVQYGISPARGWASF